MVSGMKPVATPSWEPYHVFINHRGKDTKLTVGSLIYHALEPYGLRVFLDQYVLRPGDTIETEIRGAISSSSVHIALFSKNYAESRWCLKELCWMLTSSHEPRFIPIFCDVEPWELSFVEKGCYAKAFEKHFERERKEVVVEWKEALRKAAGISGKVFKGKEALGKAANNSDTVFKCKESDDYGKLVENIEKTVMEHVKRDPLELPPHPVGLDQAWKDLQDQIKKESFKKVVVIAGLCGIGKSTLAIHIFNELNRSEFRRACFLFDVRKTHDLTSLQRQLSRDLAGIDQHISNANEGKTMLRKNLKGLKILIVFDDVDQWDKIERVLDVHAVEEGSLIFVTSRDKGIVRASYKYTPFVYDVEPLKNEDAKELFCYYATRQSNSRLGCADLVEDFLKICGGLPLSLEVLGKQLSRNSDKKHWKRRLKSYSQGASLPEANDVINELKWSCEGMDKEKRRMLLDSERRMLLDVAHFLVGEDKELAVQVLEGLDCGKDVDDSLRRLCETYLISFQNDRKIWESVGQMFLEHFKPLQSLEEPLQSREDPWEEPLQSREDPLQSLSAALMKPSSKIIMHNQVREMAMKPSSKIIMHNQVREMARCIVREDEREPLRLSCAVDFGKQSGSLSRQVRGICIREDQSPSYLPMDINITGVRLLLVEHPIHDLSTFLGSISGNLVWLRWRVSPFISFPSTISVRNLRVLELQGLQAVDLEKFFSSIHERPLELREVDINLTEGGASSSSSIMAEPEDFSKYMSALTRQFLQSIGISMKNLNKIVLNDVIISESLPFDFSELKMLWHLDLSGSSNLTALPNSFSQLLQLQHLALRDCRSLSIPVDILGEISTLEHLDFEGCVQLVHLPQGIASQRGLRYLNLLETSLLELPLTLEPSYKSEQLIIGSNKYMAFLGKSKELFLTGCFELEHISMPIEQLTCLERLEIYGCEVRILPAGISLLKHLKVLTIISCPIENFSLDNNVMDALTYLTLCGTHISAISIPAGACPMLEMVDLSHNCRLSRVELSQSTLVKLNLEGCQNLQDMNLPKLGRLKFLNIKKCGYVAIQNVAECGSLEEITAEGCRFTIKAAWRQLERPAWSQLQRRNFFTFLQYCYSFFVSTRNEYLERPAWSQLQRLNFFRFLQYCYSFFVSTRNEDLERPAWSQLQRLNFFTFSEYSYSFFRRRWKHLGTTVRTPEYAQEFEKFLKSFHGVRVQEIPSTATDESPVVLKKVHSHSAILMCLITYRDDFVVRFEACSGGARSEEFVIRHDHDYKRGWVHVYMWTQRSTLFTDDNFYDNVSIYNAGIYNRGVEGGAERGWILTFSSENHVLDMLNQIINPSAQVDSAEMDSAEYGLDWLLGESGEE